MQVFSGTEDSHKIIRKAHYDVIHQLTLSLFHTPDMNTLRKQGINCRYCEGADCGVACFTKFPPSWHRDRYKLCEI